MSIVDEEQQPSGASSLARISARALHQQQRELTHLTNMTNKTAPEVVVNDSSSDESPVDEQQRDLSYRNESYWALPENVREIVDRSNRRNTHS